MSDNNECDGAPRKEVESTTADLPPAAKRALAEAEERRRATAGEAMKASEKGGPKGPEPTRFGDWESKGRAIDF